MTDAGRPLSLLFLMGCVSGERPARQGDPESIADSALLDDPGMPADTGEAADEERTRYPTGQVHSPISDTVAQQLFDILSIQSDPNLDVFMKVGDSITYSSSYLHCFAGDDVDLGERADLSETLQYFLEGVAAESSPFDRWSASVKGGRTASWSMSGDPSPLQQEIDAIDPALAVVMFGTNDCGYFAPDTAAMLRWYGGEMLALVDALVDQGIVPILMTIPPSTRATISQLDEVVNALVRGLAQGHQIPLVDYHMVMLEAPDLGLSSDGVHPNSASAGACVLSEQGLEAGYNIRNLLTLDALDRVHRVISDDEPIDDAPSLLSSGSGTPDDPIWIDLLPFTRYRDTQSASDREIDVYDGCAAEQDETGPEEYYALSLEAETALRLVVVDQDGVDIDIHLLTAAGGGEDCLARGDTLIEGTLPAGEYRLVLDTYVSSGIEQSGEYLLVVARCDEGDEACEAQLVH